MDTFDVFSLAWLLHEATQAELCFLTLKLSGHGSQMPAGKGVEAANHFFEFAELLFRKYLLEDCLQAVVAAKNQWSKPMVDVSAACVIFNRVQAEIISSFQSKVFLRVAIDRTDFVDKDRLFGDQVCDAFISAKGDIREAGNCLAAECNTAAVFHLMRASEVTLRALARDRQVAFKDKPLEQKEWGQILPKLDAVVREMRDSDAKNWLKPEFKEAQVHFYSELVPELRSFNEAWRRHISHADTEAFYDRDQAASIMNHVRKFMQKLSTRIGETKVTPIYWDSE